MDAFPRTQYRTWNHSVNVKPCLLSKQITLQYTVVHVTMYKPSMDWELVWNNLFMTSKNDTPSDEIAVIMFLS